MAKNSTKPSTHRFFKAYFTTVSILSSYLYITFLTRILGPKRTATKLSRTHQKNALKIKKTILELKGLFIKVGQMFSIMTNFLPSELTERLEGLQDSVTPHPYKDIEARFLEEFQKKPLEIFERFEKEPIASASLGQVHVAYDTEGKKYAVKVQYPGIEEIVKSDLITLKRIFSLLHLFFPEYGVKKIYEEVREVVFEELDFMIEAKNLALIKENFKDEPDFLFPTVFHDRSTSRILTMDFMEGHKITNLEKNKELGLDSTEIAKKLVHAFCKQIFVDGHYHADPHPGNFLVQAGEIEIGPEGENWARPKIVFMDFGAMASISPAMQAGIGKFIEGIIKRDNRTISQALKDMGFISQNDNEEVFDRIVEYFYERIKDVRIDDLRNISINLAEIQRLEDLIELSKLDISFRDLLQTFNIPKDWALLERTLIVLMGLTTHLDPKLNPLKIIIPYAEEFVLGKDRSFGDLVAQAVKEVLISYLKLPDQLEKTLHKLNRGELEIQVKNDLTGSRMIARGLNRLTYAVLLVSSLTAHYLMKESQMPHEEVPLYLSWFFGSFLLLNLLRKK